MRRFYIQFQSDTPVDCRKFEKSGKFNTVFKGEGINISNIVHGPTAAKDFTNAIGENYVSCNREADNFTNEENKRTDEKRINWASDGLKVNKD